MPERVGTEWKRTEREGEKKLRSQNTADLGQVPRQMFLKVRGHPPSP